MLHSRPLSRNRAALHLGVGEWRRAQMLLCTVVISSL